MLGIQYFKADPSTYVIKTSNSRVKAKGKGLSFFYNAASTSITAIPVNVQEAAFIFGFQTQDYQEVKVQGQVSFRVEDPEKIAEVMNFTLKNDGKSYVSEDLVRLGDRVLRRVQKTLQGRIQAADLRQALLLNQSLADEVLSEANGKQGLGDLGIRVLGVGISGITPTPETSRALEASAREAILKEADDAIYLRRKSAVEQERTIKDAELQTELALQEKEQEIEEARLANERAVLRSKAEIEAERLQADIAAEEQRSQLVSLAVDNQRQESEAQAYAIEAKMKAYAQLPVENLKAMAMANMQPEQLMASGFEALALNAGKIGELNITPDLFGNLLQKRG